MFLSIQRVVQLIIPLIYYYIKPLASQPQRNPLSTLNLTNYESHRHFRPFSYGISRFSDSNNSFPSSSQYQEVQPGTLQLRRQRPQLKIVASPVYHQNNQQNFRESPLNRLVSNFSLVSDINNNIDSLSTVNNIVKNETQILDNDKIPHSMTVLNTLQQYSNSLLTNNLENSPKMPPLNELLNIREEIPLLTETVNSQRAIPPISTDNDGNVLYQSIAYGDSEIPLVPIPSRFSYFNENINNLQQFLTDSRRSTTTNPMQNSLLSETRSNMMINRASLLELANFIKQVATEELPAEQISDSTILLPIGSRLQIPSPSYNTYRESNSAQNVLNNLLKQEELLQLAMKKRNEKERNFPQAPIESDIIDERIMIPVNSNRMEITRRLPLNQQQTANNVIQDTSSSIPSRESSDHIEPEPKQNSINQLDIIDEYLKLLLTMPDPGVLVNKVKVNENFLTNNTTDKKDAVSSIHYQEEHVLKNEDTALNKNNSRINTGSPLFRENSNNYEDQLTPNNYHVNLSRRHLKEDHSLIKHHTKPLSTLYHIIELFPEYDNDLLNEISQYPIDVLPMQRELVEELDTTGFQEKSGLLPVIEPDHINITTIIKAPEYELSSFVDIKNNQELLEYDTIHSTIEKKRDRDSSLFSDLSIPFVYPELGNGATQKPSSNLYAYCYPFTDEQIVTKCGEAKQFNAVGVYIPMMMEVQIKHDHLWYSQIRRLKTETGLEIIGTSFEKPNWKLITEILTNNNGLFTGILLEWIGDDVCFSNIDLPTLKDLEIIKKTTTKGIIRYFVRDQSLTLCQKEEDPSFLNQHPYTNLSMINNLEDVYIKNHKTNPFEYPSYIQPIFACFGGQEGLCFKAFHQNPTIACGEHQRFSFNPYENAGGRMMHLFNETCGGLPSHDFYGVL